MGRDESGVADLERELDEDVGGRDEAVRFRAERFDELLRELVGLDRDGRALDLQYTTLSKARFGPRKVPAKRRSRSP